MYRFLQDGLVQDPKADVSVSRVDAPSAMLLESWCRPETIA